MSEMNQVVPKNIEPKSDVMMEPMLEKEADEEDRDDVPERVGTLNASNPNIRKPEPQRDPPTRTPAEKDPPSKEPPLEAPPEIERTIV